MNKETHLCFQNPRMLAGAPEASPHTTRAADLAPGLGGSLASTGDKAWVGTQLDVALMFPRGPSKRDNPGSRPFQNFLGHLQDCILPDKEQDRPKIDERTSVRYGQAWRVGPGGS